MCRGQCYEGINKVLEKVSDIAVQMFINQPNVHYSQCRIYSSSLSSTGVTTKGQHIKEYYEI